MFIYLGAPLGQVWVHDPWCDLAILRISNICKPPPKQFSGLRSKKYWVWQYDIWWFWTSRLNVSSKELDDAEKKDINPPRKKIENNVGNCHKPTMGMVFFAPITMVMTWGWFMALDLPHQFSGTSSQSPGPVSETPCDWDMPKSARICSFPMSLANFFHPLNFVMYTRNS